MESIPLSTPDTLQASFCTTRGRGVRLRRARSCYPVTSWSDTSTAPATWCCTRRVMPGVTPSSTKHPTPEPPCAAPVAISTRATNPAGAATSRTAELSSITQAPKAPAGKTSAATGPGPPATAATTAVTTRSSSGPLCRRGPAGLPGSLPQATTTSTYVGRRAGTAPGPPADRLALVAGRGRGAGRRPELAAGAGVARRHRGRHRRQRDLGAARRGCTVEAIPGLGDTMQCHATAQAASSICLESYPIFRSFLHQRSSAVFSLRYLLTIGETQRGV